MQDIKWEFAVKQSEDIEAWSTVGNVMISTGLLDMVGADDDQLAAVLAPEVAHTLARHSVSFPKHLHGNSLLKIF